MKTKPNMPQVKCPKCGRPQPGTLGSDGIYLCGHCNMQFDKDGDDGGDYSDRDPSARLERLEREQARKQQRRQR